MNSTRLTASRLALGLKGDLLSGNLRKLRLLANGGYHNQTWRNYNTNGLFGRAIHCISPVVGRYSCMTSMTVTLPQYNFVGMKPTTSAKRLLHTSGSNENEVQEKMLPPLMSFPHILWPSFVNAIRNWFFITFIIKPYFDKDFSMHDFIAGAKEAVSVVSTKLSEGKLEELEGLVDSSALTQIKESISKFTVFQQQLLRVASEDVFFAFPYQVGIIIVDDQPSDRFAEGERKTPQTRHVEITVCLHVLRGLAEKQRSGETGASFNFQEFTKDERNKYNVMICNYRFFKDFTQGAPDPSWIVNMANHFLPAEFNR